MEWTKSETLRFIDLWQGFPCLWNSKHPDYRHKENRRNALSQLAEHLNTDVSVVEKKIISLKTQFNREIHKLKTKAEAGLDTDSSWYAYQYLLFLKDSIPRPCPDPLMVAKTEHEPQEDVIVEQIEYGPENAILISQPHIIPCKRKHHHDSQSGTQSSFKDAPKDVDKKLRADEYEIFGQSVASELREIKCKRRLLMLKKEIMDLVFKTKIEIIDSESEQGLSYDEY